MANKVSNEQLEKLLDFLAEHTTLVKGVRPGARSKETIDKQWNDLAMKLNSFGSGSSKSGERWKKYWADIKHKSKSRLAKRRQDAIGTGGGPSKIDDLTEVDKKVLAIIGEQAVYGDTQLSDPMFHTTPEELVTTPVIIHSTGSITKLPEECNSDLTTPVTLKEVQVETQVPEPHCKGSQSGVDLDGVIELERNRLNYEKKMADIVKTMAEAANKMAEASLMNAETSRKQLEVLKSLVEIVDQLSKALTAKESH